MPLRIVTETGQGHAKGSDESKKSTPVLALLLKFLQ